MWLGRADNAWEHRGDVVRGRSTRPPSGYVGRFYVDSVVFDPAVLEMLVATVGEDRVMLGSDNPSPLGERPVGDVVRRSDLGQVARDKVLGGNAAMWLGPAASVTS